MDLTFSQAIEKAQEKLTSVEQQIRQLEAEQVPYSDNPDDIFWKIDNDLQELEQQAVELDTLIGKMREALAVSCIDDLALVFCS